MRERLFPKRNKPLVAAEYSRVAVGHYAPCERRRPAAQKRNVGVFEPVLAEDRIAVGRQRKKHVAFVYCIPLIVAHKLAVAPRYKVHGVHRADRFVLRNARVFQHEIHGPYFGGRIFDRRYEFTNIIVWHAM